MALLGAESERITPIFAEAQMVVQELVPQAEPVVLAGATHALQTMNSSGVADALAAFFARHPIQPIA